MREKGKPQNFDEGPSSFGDAESQKPLVIGPPFLLIEEEEDERCLSSHLKTSLSFHTEHVAVSHGSLGDGATSDRKDAQLVPSNNARLIYPDHPGGTSRTKMMDGDQAEVKLEDKDAPVNRNRSGTPTVSTSAYPKTSWRIIDQDSSAKTSEQSVEESFLGPLSNLTSAQARFFNRNLPPAYRFRMLGRKLNGVIMGNVRSKCQKKDLRMFTGCTNQTKEECMRDLIFGLPAKHWDYVQEVEHGYVVFFDWLAHRFFSFRTTVYLFNYSKRCLHGIFKAVGGGQWKLKPHGMNFSKHFIWFG